MSPTAELENTVVRTTEQIVEEAVAEFNRAKDRLLKDLATTPDDKLRWSPTSTARTPLMQVAHAGMSIDGILDMLNGKPFDFENMPALDREWRAAEAKVATREEAIEILERSSERYIAWMRALSPEKVLSTIEMPFGAFPMVQVITWLADHVRNHCAQLEYIQTAYGDLTWHM
jgi:hypothetical protein